MGMLDVPALPRDAAGVAKSNPFVPAGAGPLPIVGEDPAAVVADGVGKHQGGPHSLGSSWASIAGDAMSPAEASRPEACSHGWTAPLTASPAGAPFARFRRGSMARPARPHPSSAELALSHARFDPAACQILPAEASQKKPPMIISTDCSA